MKPSARRFNVAVAAFALLFPSVARELRAQGSPLLQITSIQAEPGSPVQFSFNDGGTGATNYLVEFAPNLQGGGVWSNVTSAVVHPGGASAP